MFETGTGFSFALCEALSCFSSAPKGDREALRSGSSLPTCAGGGGGEPRSRRGQGEGRRQKRAPEREPRALPASLEAF